MFFGNKKELKITQEEYYKLHVMFDDLQRENAELKKRCNYEHLVAQINSLDLTIKTQSNSIKDLINKNKILLDTINKERAVCSLVLQKLDEVSKGCNDSINKLYHRTDYVTANDFKLNIKV
jgi:myosin heavy subunit